MYIRKWANGRSRLAMFLFVLLFSWTNPASAEVQVLTSIKPVHSLVASVMKGVSEPAVLVDGAGSPHRYSLKPSHAVKMEAAQIIFWIGPDFETFLEKPISTIGASARSIVLLQAAGLSKLDFRADFHSESEEDHTSGEHDHHDSHVDPHIWLDPKNAAVLVKEISATLIAADPENADTYAANARDAIEQLGALTSEIDALIKPVRDSKFFVFHDAYRYFENRFGLSTQGAVTVSPESKPGAARLAAIQAKLTSTGAVCVFTEPQFESKIVSVITSGTNIRSAVLDPLGSGLKSGPDLYFELMRAMAMSMRACLG